MNILICPDGTLKCLYTEDLDLRELGTLQITRATDIRFNEVSQVWDVIAGGANSIYSNASRAACIEWEKQNLQPNLLPI